MQQLMRIFAAMVIVWMDAEAADIRWLIHFTIHLLSFMLISLLIF